jgi:hypothetical protein
MIRRTMIGLAAAATLTGGLGAYGAASAFAATTAPTPPASSSKPTPSASSTSPAGRDAMIRHCTDHLPAGERAKARQQMQRMMSGDGTMMSGGTAGSSMMGDTADSAGKG